MYTIKAGTIGCDIGSKKKSAPKYRFNQTVEALVVDTEIRGCGEFAHERVIVLIEGKRITIRKES